MMVALILAQLVQSWPWLDSPRVQPGPTICVGECAGPVVWGPAERGRLVVACDMRSATCSDGRQITTTRASPVPCEVSPGVWEMVPEDTGCYGVRGLESWTANTSYLSWGAELDRSPWRAANGATLAKQDGFYRITGTTSSSRMFQSGIPSIPGPHTLACVLRTDEPGINPETSKRLQIWWGSGAVTPVPVTSTWATYSITRTVPEDAQDTMSVHVYSGVGTVDVIGCWLTRTDTPGRPCWGGEAPVTCAADSHTISTEGWPTEAGEVSLVYTPGQAENAARYLISASTFGVEGWEVYVRHDDTISFLVHNNGTTIYSSAPLTWEPRPYALRVRWGDGIVSFWRDGVLVGTRSMTRLPNGLTSTALIGNRGASGYVNGSISNLRIRGIR